ncbi:MAG: AI-2E family transporter [Akkermansiaceae bacterium]
MTLRSPSRFQRKTLWRALTGLGILVIGLLVVGSIWLVGKVLGYLQPVLVPLAVAGIVAYLLDPIVTWLQQKGLSRLKAVVSVFFSFIIIIGLLVWMILPPIVSQLSDDKNRQELSENLVYTFKDLKEHPWVNYWLEQDEGTEEVILRSTSTPTPADSSIIEEDVAFENTRLAALLPENIVANILGWVKGGTSKLLGFFGIALGFAMSPIYLYYFLKESSGIKAHWHEYVPLKASKFKDEVVGTLQEINGYLISFFRGQMLVAFIDGLLVGLGLMIFGLPYGLVIGLSLAVLGVIPFIGNIICMIPACIIAYVHFSKTERIPLSAENIQVGERIVTQVGGEKISGFVSAIENQEMEVLINTWSFLPQVWAYPVIVIAIFLVVQQINSLVTAPKIVGDSVGLHPMTVIFSMLFWSLLLGGFIGALLAVPLTAAVKVLFRRYFWERKMKEPEAKSDADLQELEPSTQTS